VCGGDKNHKRRVRKLELMMLTEVSEWNATNHIEEFHAHDGTPLAISPELPTYPFRCVLRVAGFRSVKYDDFVDRNDIFEIMITCSPMRS